MRKLTCICGSKECSGVSAVFKVLHDRRGAHVGAASALESTWRKALQLNVNFNDGVEDDKGNGNLERLHELLQVEEEEAAAHEMNDVMSGISTTAASAASEQFEHFVALHHFHPEIIEENTIEVIPSKLVRLKRSVFRSKGADIVAVPFSDDGTITLGDCIIVVPNYSMDKVKLEAQALFRAYKENQTKKQQAIVQELTAKAKPLLQQSPSPPVPTRISVPSQPQLPQQTTTNAILKSASSLTMNSFEEQKPETLLSPSFCDSDEPLEQKVSKQSASNIILTTTNEPMDTKTPHGSSDLLPALETCQSVDSGDDMRIYHDGSSFSSHGSHDTGEQGDGGGDDEQYDNMQNKQTQVNATGDGRLEQQSRNHTVSASGGGAVVDSGEAIETRSKGLRHAKYQIPPQEHAFQPNGAVTRHEEVGVNEDDLVSVDSSSLQQPVARPQNLVEDNDLSEVSLLDSYSTIGVDDHFGLPLEVEPLLTNKAIAISLEMSRLDDALAGNANETGTETSSFTQQSSTGGESVRENDLSRQSLAESSKRHDPPPQQDMLDETSIMKEFMVNAVPGNGLAVDAVVDGLVKPDSLSTAASEEAKVAPEGALYDSKSDKLVDLFPAPAGHEPLASDGENSVTSAKIEAGGKRMSLEEFFDKDASEMDAMFEGPIDVDALTDAYLSKERGIYRFRKYTVDDGMNIVVEDPTDEELSQARALQPLKLLNEELGRDASETMAVMTAIESKRRCWAMAELDTMTTEWSWYRIIIQRMLKQTDHVEDLLESSFNALAVYSLMLKNICSDSFLDDEGDLVSGADNRSRTAELRRNTAKESSVLDPMYRCLREISDRVSEDNELLDMDVLAMTELRVDLVKNALLLLRRGNEVTSEVGLIESRIQEAWDQYEVAEGRTLNDCDNRTHDRWLAEASYKTIIKSGMAGWKENFLRMANLYDEIISLDSLRRTRTKEVLLSFIPRRRKIYIRINELLTPCKLELEVGRQSHLEHEQSIENVLQQLSRVKLSMKPNRSSIMNRSRTFHSDIGSPIDLQALTTRNLFDSHRVKEVKAIEFQSSNRSVFEIGLAVTTSDDHLHIIKSASDTVLSASSFYGDTKQAEIQLRDQWNGCLPTYSMYLPECEYAIAEDNSRIIIAKRNIVRSADEQLAIRLFSPRETLQWWHARLESRMEEQRKSSSMQRGSTRHVNGIHRKTN
ncbi:hypothetical protein MPSEU_000988800 [Mayamaea pseudoterrestris]|nr:hypothetical protein MPSEU_000988800 [Mayamaea pseudoterrestris]